MGEDDDSDKPGPAGDPAAAGIALGAPLDPRAAAYLDEQTRLARLQAESMVEQNAFELSHLRWRRFNDQMKGALQIMVVTLGVAVVGGIAAAVWNASQADGLVIERFSVPPRMVDDGMGGDVIADDLTAKLAAIRQVAYANSFDDLKGVRKDAGEDITVEIPETGISLAQAWRYLKLWFGHEQHLTGNLRDLGGGRIALSLALDGAAADIAAGKAADLDRLEQQAAEQVFARVDPVNFAVYLNASGRVAEALAAAANAVRKSRHDNGALADAYSFWAFETRYATGDLALTAARARLAMAVAPKVATPHLELLRNAVAQGHDEDALVEARLLLGLHVGDQPAFQRASFADVQQTAATVRDMAAGDFGRALSGTCDYCSAAENDARAAQAAALLHDIARARALLGDAIAGQAALAEDSNKGRFTAAAIAAARYAADVASEDWHAAAIDAQVKGAGYRPPLDACLLGKPSCERTQSMPPIALALARSGDLEDARAAADATPLDCYDCLRVRAQIAALARNDAAAAAWFARAVAAAPSPALAYADWGEMLLRKGDFAGAIAKFALANQKGPHFADPLELWGEALVASNRSDLALAKFEEAARAAPNWGRLHFKWGEALLWLGRKDDAARQFALAANLYLTPAERATLAVLSR